MDQLEHLDKRRHVRQWMDEYPEKRVIESVLWKAWKVTPSKQNFMPYTVTILGPDKVVEKEFVWGLSRKNKIDINESHKEGWKEPGDNPDYDYIKTAPYVLIFSQRAPCKPTRYIEFLMSRNYDHFEQMHDTEKELESMVRGCATEIGMYAANLTAFCLEEGIDISYTACFPSKVKHWKDIPIITHDVLLVMGLGYCKVSRREAMHPKMSELDQKPEPEEIIKWI